MKECGKHGHDRKRFVIKQAENRDRSWDKEEMERLGIKTKKAYRKFQKRTRCICSDNIKVI